MLGECHSLEANKVILHIQTFLHQKHFLNPGVKYMKCMACDLLRRQMKMWFGQHFFTKEPIPTFKESLVSDSLQ